MTDDGQASGVRLLPELHALLVVQWVQMLAQDRLGTTQAGSGKGPTGTQTYSFGDPASVHFVLAYAPEDGEWSIETVSGVAHENVEAVLEEAIAQAEAMNTGPDVVYRITVSSAGLTLSSGDLLHFMRLLGDQVRIQGRRRLSDRVILEFIEEPVPEGQSLLFAPKTQVTVTLFVPGPVAGPLAQRTAGGLAEVVSAICTLALGRVVTENLPTLFPAKPEEAQAAAELRYDPEILTLARDGISLDIFGDLGRLAGSDGTLRARGALLSYQAALEQRNSDVALMLLVTSIEALIAPRPAWGKDKVTKRFIRTIEELCPDAVDAIVNHANAQEAFMVKFRGGVQRRRRDLLDTIYTMRSNPTHTGVTPTTTGTLFQLADAGGMRVALLSDLARGALLAYLLAPRSSLIGHPLIDLAPPAPDQASPLPTS